LSATAAPPRSRRGDYKALRRRLFPRRLRFTREGKIYVLVTFGVGFAAVNTGNNLLFLVLGLLLGLIIVSGILSEISLRGLEISRSLPERAQAGVIFPAELSLKNTKRRAPSFGIELRDEIDGEPFRRRCFFLRVGAEERRAIAYRCELPRRGVASFDGTIIATRFPFGLFEKRRFISLPEQLIVLPAQLELEPPSARSARHDGLRTSLEAGSGQEYRELREMVEGDDPRRIHWRATARLGRPLIRETDLDAGGWIEIVLDPAPEPVGESGVARAERNIAAAATLVRKLRARGISVRLSTVEDQVLDCHDARGEMALLEHLALIDVDDAARRAPPVGRSPLCIALGPRAVVRGTAHRPVLPQWGGVPGEGAGARVG
jgi:uncharacterized protein (DUF58 family)